MSAQYTTEGCFTRRLRPLKHGDVFQVGVDEFVCFPVSYVAVSPVGSGGKKTTRSVDKNLSSIYRNFTI